MTSANCGSGCFGCGDCHTRLGERSLGSVALFWPQICDYTRLLLALPLVVLLPDRGEIEARRYVALAYTISHLLDFFDGRIARAFDQCSHFGILLDHTLDIMCTAFMWVVLASESNGDRDMLHFLLFDAVAYTTVVMLLINRAIQNGRFRGVPGVPDGIAGKWDVPMCVKNGGFLIPGHALFMWHQAWLAMLYVDPEGFMPNLQPLAALMPKEGEGYPLYYIQRGHYQLPIVLANVAYYIMVAHICYKCCETYSEPAPGLKKQEESKAKSSSKKKA